jgi:hypothetical protein
VQGDRPENRGNADTSLAIPPAPTTPPPPPEPRRRAEDPPDSEEYRRRSGFAGWIDAGGNVAERVAKLTPQQALTLVAVVLMFVLCYLLGVRDYRSAGADAERVALLMRVQESEAEKNRLMMSGEFQNNRAAFTTEGKANREAVMEVARLMQASQQATNAEVAKLSTQVQLLTAAIIDLKRKLPPEEAAVPMPRAKGYGGEANVSPMPRVKGETEPKG